MWQKNQSQVAKRDENETLKCFGEQNENRSAKQVCPLTLGVLVAAGFVGTGQLWLEVDLLGEAPLDDGRDLRPL